MTSFQKQALLKAAQAVQKVFFPETLSESERRGTSSAFLKKQKEQKSVEDLGGYVNAA